MVPIYNGLMYSFYADIPYAIESIQSTYFKWRRKLLGNSGPKTLPVKNVIVEPSYISNPVQKRAWTKQYCASSGAYTVVKADTKVLFALPCRF